MAPCNAELQLNKPVLLVFALFVCSFRLEAGEDRPKALEKMQEAREKLKTGAVEYDDRRYDIGPPSGVHRTAKVAGPDVIGITQMLKNRFAEQTPEGQGFVADGPHCTLKRDKEIWMYQSDGFEAILSTEDKRADNAMDFRTLGVTCFESCQDLHDILLWRDAASHQYSETVENGLHVVTAKTEYGQFTWWINPQRGWNTERVTFEKNGKILQEARISLREFDGTWFPDAVVYFRAGFKEGKEPVQMIRVTSASFNQPKQPRRFTPADIGIESGMTIQRYGAKPGEPLMIYDGDKLITLDEFAARERVGEVKRGPNNERAIARAIAAEVTEIGIDRAYQSMWAKYVTDFIARYKLDAAQVSTAFTILRDCEEQAGRYITARKDEFDAYSQDAEALTAQKDKTPDSDKIKELEVRQSRLLGPIEKIFETQLKPKLERIPTRAQRRNAELPADAPRGETKPPQPARP